MRRVEIWRSGYGMVLLVGAIGVACGASQPRAVQVPPGPAAAQPSASVSAKEAPNPLGGKTKWVDDGPEGIAACVQDGPDPSLDLRQIPPKRRAQMEASFACARSAQDTGGEEQRYLACTRAGLDQGCLARTMRRSCEGGSPAACTLLAGVQASGAPNVALERAVQACRGKDAPGCALEAWLRSGSGLSDRQPEGAIRWCRGLTKESGPCTAAAKILADTSPDGAIALWSASCAGGVVLDCARARALQRKSGKSPSLRASLPGPTAAWCADEGLRRYTQEMRIRIHGGPVHWMDGSDHAPEEEIGDALRELACESSSAVPAGSPEAKAASAACSPLPDPMTLVGEE